MKGKIARLLRRIADRISPKPLGSYHAYGIEGTMQRVKKVNEYNLGELRQKAVFQAVAPQLKNEAMGHWMEGQIKARMVREIIHELHEFIHVEQIPMGWSDKISVEATMIIHRPV